MLVAYFASCSAVCGLSQINHKFVICWRLLRQATRSFVRKVKSKSFILNLTISQSSQGIDAHIQPMPDTFLVVQRVSAPLTINLPANVNSPLQMQMSCTRSYVDYFISIEILSWNMDWFVTDQYIMYILLFSDLSHPATNSDYNNAMSDRRDASRYTFRWG